MVVSVAPIDGEKAQDSHPAFEERIGLWAKMAPTYNPLFQLADDKLERLLEIETSIIGANDRNAISLRESSLDVGKDYWNTRLAIVLPSSQLFSVIAPASGLNGARVGLSIETECYAAEDAIMGHAWPFARKPIIFSPGKYRAAQPFLSVTIRHSDRAEADSPKVS